MNPDYQLTFKLTFNEANLLIAGLAKLPFEAVADLIGNLQKQADEQIKAEQAKATGTTK